MTLLLWLKIPPSVLPDISPSRGEIGWRTVSLFSEAENSACHVRIGQGASPWPISPLEGEMSGRTEGGIAG